MIGWRDKYKVHPAADVFPMMSDEELDTLGADIKANGLRMPIVLVAGRNRLEAMERAGIELPRTIDVRNGSHTVTAQNVIDSDPVAFIISENIHRRHLTKQQQADYTVAALKAGEEYEKPCQLGTVSAEPNKGGRGKKNPLKTKALAIAKEQGISKRTMQRSLAKAEGRDPKPKIITIYGEDDGTAEEETRASMRVRGFLTRAQESEEMAEADDLEGIKITEEIYRAAYRAMAAWQKIYTSLRVETPPVGG